MKSKNLFIFFICMICSQNASLDEIDSMVRETTDSVLEQLNEYRSRLESDPELIQQIAHELIVPHFDFNKMSELVMGDHWQKLGSSQKDCFVSGLRYLLVERYAYILLSYDNHNITYEAVSGIDEEGYVLVKQTISREGATPLPIEYITHNVVGEWKVVDLIIDGVSLVRNYLGMFQSKIHLQGLDYFINNFPTCNIKI